MPSTIEEFNVDCRVECGQLNLAHVARNKKYKILKLTNASAHLVRSKSKIREGSPNGTRRLLRKGFVKDEF